MNNKYKVLIGIVVLLVIVRLTLPYVILHYANKSLANLDGYSGRITDIDLAIYRGAYTIKDIYINKVDSTTKEETVFFKSTTIDLSIEWSAILNGEIVGELLFDTPVLVFTKDRVEPKEITKDSTDFRHLLDNFMPLRINRCEVNNGELRYTDEGSSPLVDIAVTQLHVLARNLTNVTHDTIPLPSTVYASAYIYEGTFQLDMKLNIMQQRPMFDVDAKLENTNLPLLNDFLKAYTNFDVSKGTFSVYTEAAAKDGKFVGYIKPIIKELAVIGTEDKNDSFLNQLYEHLIAAAAFVLKNKKEEQIASKVEIAGDFENPQAGILQAIFEVLRNAFIQALMPALDHEISIQTIKGKETEGKSNFITRILNSN